MERYQYTYRDFKDDIEALYTSIKQELTPYDIIVGVTRGGLIPAVRLSHMLGIPMVTLSWSTRDGQVQEVRNPEITYAHSLGKNILVVDDIVDDGITAKGIMDAFPFVDYASLIYNNINKSGITPKHYGWEINRNEVPGWIEFWWEKNYG